MGKRPEKHLDVLSRTRERIANGQYRDTRHASERKGERSISLLEVRQVIGSGWHEKSKDEFKTEWQTWNYAIRGKTVDGRELRVAVSFDEEDYLLIITVMEL